RPRGLSRGLLAGRAAISDARRLLSARGCQKSKTRGRAPRAFSDITPPLAAEGDAHEREAFSFSRRRCSSRHRSDRSLPLQQSPRSRSACPEREILRKISSTWSPRWTSNGRQFVLPHLPA